MSNRPIPKPAPRPLPAGAPERPDPMIGLLLAGRYNVVEVLARGGMARVYRARDDRLDRDVAAKILSLPYADDEAFTRRFLAEARAAASLSHPNLVHVYESGSVTGLHYIVMELLEGYRSLRQVLAERGPMPGSEVAALGRELLAGLAVVHGRGLVHCDVKSANVMLGPGPTKLIDFGIARSPSDVPRDGSSIGSLHYMAPEQLRGEALTAASDLFSLGVVMYEALTGRVPYPGEQPQAVAAAHRAGYVIAPSALGPHVPRRLADAVIQALRPEPRHRFESAAAMERALAASVAEDATANGGTADHDTTVIARLTPPSRRPGDGYVPPILPREPPISRRSSAARVATVRPATHPAPRRRPFWGLFGTAAVLAAALLVVVLLIVPLLELGGGTPGSGATPVASPVTPAPGALVEVPNAIGMSKDQAIAAATGAGLHNWQIRCAQDESRPPAIYDQEPPPGAMVPPGSRFTMFSPRFEGWCDD